MRTLAEGSLLFSFVYLLTISVHSDLPPRGHGWVPIAAKFLAIALVVVLAGTAKSRNRLLILALCFSVGGDYLLAVKRLGALGPAQLFMFGLIAFLIAHLFYIALFCRERSKTPSSVWRKIACGMAVAVAIAMLIVLWDGLAQMRWPVLAYSIVLTAMVISAQLSRYAGIVAMGALCFLASDTMLALNVFGHSFAGARQLVWIFYYAAQIFITTGVIAQPKRFSVGAH